MTNQPELMQDYSITAFLCEETWNIKYQVHPIGETNPKFKRPIFDTFELAKQCIYRLRDYPKTFLTRCDDYSRWEQVNND